MWVLLSIPWKQTSFFYRISLGKGDLCVIFRELMSYHNAQFALTHTERTQRQNTVLSCFVAFEYDPKHAFNTIIRPDFGYNFKAPGSEQSWNKCL